MDEIYAWHQQDIHFHVPDCTPRYFNQGNFFPEALSLAHWFQKLNNAFCGIRRCIATFA